MAFVSGAAGRAASALAVGQKRGGHQVTVVTSRAREGVGDNDRALLATLVDHGIDVHTIDTLAVRQTAANADVVQFVHDQLGTAAAFDVLHTHGTVPSVIAIAAARRITSRVPILQTTHAWTVSRSAPGRQAYDLEVMNLVDRAVVPTWTVADYFATRGVVRRQLAVVPYGVPADPPPPSDDTLYRVMEAWREAGGLVLCYVSATTTSHDLRLLANSLPAVDPALRMLCVVFGQPQKGPAVAIPNDGPVRVRMAPAQASVREYTKVTDVLVLPSGDGDQPLAVLEAFCDQVPVLASRVPELTEFIDDRQTGWLFDPADPRALADTISLARTTAPDALRALCQRARVRYQSEFTVDRMVSGYMREYARLAS
jgi:glycosyltransferase involved in cell wall biosynthesis